VDCYDRIAATGGHPFYQPLDRVIDEHRFDAFFQAECAPSYALTRGRTSLTPGTHFRRPLIDIRTSDAGGAGV
jgi:hypothetical protein